MCGGKARNTVRSRINHQHDSRTNDVLDARLVPISSVSTQHVLGALNAVHGAKDLTAGTHGLSRGNRQCSFFSGSDDSSLPRVSNSSLMAAEGKSDREPLRCLAIPPTGTQKPRNGIGMSGHIYSEKASRQKRRELVDWVTKLLCA
jgi:hypothetical protein